MTPRDSVLAWARGNSPIAVHPAYIRMAGDVGAGVLLSQIVYWHSDTKEGQRRGGVDRDGETWVAKPAGEWARELGLDPDSGQGPAKVVRRYLTHLQAAGIIEADVFKFGGAPTLHVRVRWDALSDALAGYSDFPEMESPRIHMWKMDFPTVGKSSKEAETTTETTEANASATADAGGRPDGHAEQVVVNSSAGETVAVMPKRKGKPKPGADPRVRPLLLALADIRGYPITEWGAEGAAAKRGLAAGYEPDAILGCARRMAADPFWQDKPLTMASVVKQAGVFSRATVTIAYDDRGNQVLR